MCGLLIVGNDEIESKLQNNGVAPRQLVPTRIQIKKEKYPGKLFATFSFTSCHIWAIPCQRSKKKGQRQKVDFKK